MNTKPGIAFALMLSIAVSAPLSNQALAESDSVRQMAKIVMQLNHHPGKQDKQLLNNIAEKGSAAERSIASALLNMEHKVGPSDKTRLMQISNNKDLPDNTRELAMIVSKINHKASSADKQKLQGM